MTYADADSTERTAAGNTTYTNAPNGITATRASSQNTYYMRTDTGTLVAQKLPAGTVHYYLYDGLGSVVNIVDTNGTAQATYTYDAWGNTALSGSAAAGNPFRYVGGTAEPGGLIKFGTRYYDPVYGRWTQQDAAAGSPERPASLNRYVYAECEPVSSTDESGYSIFDSLERKIGFYSRHPRLLLRRQLVSAATSFLVGTTCAVGVLGFSGGTAAPAAFTVCKGLALVSGMAAANVVDRYYGV